MKTVALFFILMTALCLTRGFKRIPGYDYGPFKMKTWIIIYFDMQLKRFLRRNQGNFKLTPNQVTALQFINRKVLMLRCRFYLKSATDYLKKRRKPLSELYYSRMGRFFGRFTRMRYIYQKLISDKKIPKLTKSMKKILAELPGYYKC